YEGGIANMRYSISNTAEYGDFTRGPRVINAQVKAEMKRILEEVQTGQFAREFILENQAGAPTLKAMRRIAAEHPIEEVGSKLRDMMPWLKVNTLVDKERNFDFGDRRQGRAMPGLIGCGHARSATPLLASAANRVTVERQQVGRRRFRLHG